MEKKVLLVFMLLFTGSICFAKEGADNKFIVEDGKVKYQGLIGTYYKIPAEQVHFMLWLNTVEEIESRKNKIKEEIANLGTVDKYYKHVSDYRNCFVPVSGITDYFDDDTASVNVYGDDDKLKFLIYYNLVDSDIYVRGTHTKDKKIVVRDEIVVSSFTEEFYRIGESKIENGVFKVVFPKGTWFTYRMADWRRLFGKDSDYITIHIPKILEKPNFIYYRKTGEKEFRFEYLKER